ncbi:hypothetical protein LXL04_002393 [Taraxacum kok-saghyz]
MNDPSSFLHEYPSHHVHTICNNGGADQSSNDNQSVSNVVANGYLSHLQEMSTVHLNLSISEPLTRGTEINLERAFLLKLINISYKCEQWTSINGGDLVVKFYYGKKKMVWEFLYGSMKRKMEIRWAQVSAFNTTVEEDKNCRLEIELEEPPEYFKEGEFRPRKHTQWEKSNDFTQGQAPLCRYVLHHNKLYLKLEKLSPDFDLLEKVHEAAEELQMLIDEKSYHLVSATTKQKHMDDAAHEEEEEHSNETPRLKQSHTFENIDRHMTNMSMNLPWAGSCEEDALKMQLQWPSRLSFVGEAILNEREVRTYESTSALSLANFTSSLFEFVARLQNLLNSFKELSEKAKFTARKTLWRRRRGVSGQDLWDLTIDHVAMDIIDYQKSMRHTILFSPGVLEEPLKNLLQQDNRLLYLYQQPFPVHNSPFFDIPSFQLSYNNGASGSSFVPHSNYVQNNLVQPFVAHNAPMSDLVTFPNSYVIPYVNEKAANGVWEQSGINNHLVQHLVAHNHNAPMPVFDFFHLTDLVTFPISYVNEKAANGVWEQSGRNNQIQDIPLPPITEVDYDIFEGLEPIISDEQLESLLNSFNFDSTCNDTLEENHTNSFNPFVDGSRSYNGGVNVMNDGINGDDDVCTLAQQLFNHEEFVFLEPCYWPSFECSTHDYKNGGGNGGSST